MPPGRPPQQVKWQCTYSQQNFEGKSLSLLASLCILGAVLSRDLSLTRSTNSGSLFLRSAVSANFCLNSKIHKSKCGGCRKQVHVE